MTIELSVIIPVLNGAETLGEELDSLAVQTAVEAPWEVIVADNGSTDLTRELVRERTDAFPVPLRLVDASDHPGAAHARNAGALIAEGRFLAFCDADDRVGPLWVGSAMRALRGAEVVGGPLRALKNRHNDEAPVLRSSVEHSRRGPMVSGSGNMAIHRALFIELGGFDTSMPVYGGEDSEFAVRLHRHGAQVAEVEDFLLYFRQTESTRPALRKAYLSGKAEAILWKRHPSYYPEAQTKLWPLRALAELPGALVGGIREKQWRSLLRYLIRRAGNFSGRYVTHRRLPAQRLMGSADAPSENRR